MSNIGMEEAAALSGIPRRLLQEWALEGAVPGATHEGPRKHWQIQRHAFEAALQALRNRYERRQRSLGAEVQRPLPLPPTEPVAADSIAAKACRTAASVVQRELPKLVRSEMDARGEQRNAHGLPVIGPRMAAELGAGSSRVIVEPAPTVAEAAACPPVPDRPPRCWPAWLDQAFAAALGAVVALIAAALVR